MESNDCLTNEMLTKRESEVREATLAKSDAFKSQNAQRHFKEGFVRRHYMLQSSRLYLNDRCSQMRKESLSPYEATDCAIYLNAYYLNLCGALDNLAWVLQCEYELLNGVTEIDKKRMGCGLFKEDFLKCLSLRHPKLAGVLNNNKTWIRTVVELRDPAAHRIPIYVPPSVITTKEQIEKFRSLEAEIAEHIHGDGNRSVSEFYREAQAVAEFMPIMILSTHEGLRLCSIDKQVRYDQGMYLKIASAVLEVF